MSKSLGNVINPITYIDQFGSDALRYFLMKELSLESDMVFSHDLFNEVYNADLANIYGNLVSRVMGMIQQYCHGTIITHPQVKQDIYTTFIMSTTELIDVCRSCINSFQIHELIKNVLTYAKSANKAIEDVKP
jgi:methionyl-tRNA synthetase